MRMRMTMTIFLVFRRHRAGSPTPQAWPACLAAITYSHSCTGATTNGRQANSSPRRPLMAAAAQSPKQAGRGTAATKLPAGGHHAATCNLLSIYEPRELNMQAAIMATLKLEAQPTTGRRVQEHHFQPTSGTTYAGGCESGMQLFTALTKRGRDGHAVTAARKPWRRAQAQSSRRRRGGRKA